MRTPLGEMMNRSSYPLFVLVIQLILLALIPLAWLSHFYGTGQTYVHLDVALIVTGVSILGIILSLLQIRTEF